MVEVKPLPEINETAKAPNVIDSLLDWIRTFFSESGGKTAVLGMSGGKDSTVCAALLVRALGTENVVGVFMPNGVQPDLDDAHAAAAAAGLTRTVTVNVHDAYDAIASQVPCFSRDSQAGINLAPRLRMSTLYAVAQTVEAGRVCCTGNLSEGIVGYCTLYGDLAGDFAPLAFITKQDVCIIGKELGLPGYLVDKAPSDGLSGKSDEEKMGVTYGDILTFIRDAQRLPAETYKKIVEMHDRSQFKRRIMHIPAWGV